MGKWGSYSVRRKSYGLRAVKIEAVQAVGEGAKLQDSGVGTVNANDVVNVGVHGYSTGREHVTYSKDIG